jgi:hypothetical protein
VENLNAEIEGTLSDERTQSFREELDMSIKGTGIDTQETKLVEATRREFRSRLADVEARSGCGCGGNTVTGANRIKLRRFDG